MKKLFFLFILLIISTLCYSQEINTDRPDQTESSIIVPKNNLQIESGFLFMDDTLSKSTIIPTILLRYGINKTFEFRLVTEYVSLKEKATSFSKNGFADIQIGTKINLLNKENNNLKIAFLSHLILPLAKNNISNNKLGSINKLAISHPFTKSIDIGYNVGYDYFGFGVGDVTYSISLATNILNNLGLYLEPYGRFLEIKNLISNFNFGFTYLVKNNVQLDISYGTGLNNTMKYFSGGISWNIGKI